MDTTELSYWLATLYLPGLGPRTVKQWLTQFPDLRSIFTATRDEQLAKGLSSKMITAMQHLDWRQIEADLAWAQKSHHHLLTLTDEAYPTLLKEISDPPLVLFVRGDKTILSLPQIAVVGARNATPMGLQNADWFTRALVENGYAITSGLALGIDAVSHRAALIAGGITLAVAGTGLHHTYPVSHRSLVEEIIQKGGAVISEFPLATPPLSAHFPRRNRIIAGLSLGVLVIEAALKSGSLITARHSLEHGREVFAIPGSIHNALARGCHHLIRQGAKLVETAADITEELGAYKCIQSFNQSVNTNEAFSSSVSARQAELTSDQRVIFDHIGCEITPIDVILLRSGLTAGKVSSILLVLELNGYIQSVSGGYIRTILNH